MITHCHICIPQCADPILLHSLVHDLYFFLKKSQLGRKYFGFIAFVLKKVFLESPGMSRSQLKKKGFISSTLMFTKVYKEDGNRPKRMLPFDTMQQFVADKILLYGVVNKNTRRI